MGEVRRRRAATELEVDPARRRTSRAVQPPTSDGQPFLGNKSAEALDADVLLVLTDVAHVESDFATSEAKPILASHTRGPAARGLSGRLDGTEDRRPSADSTS